MGPPESNSCQTSLYIHTFAELGVPLAMEKLEGPSTTLIFLGVEINTTKMEIRLPDEKFQCIRQELTTWMGKKKATKCHTLSLVGQLQHASKVIRYGHPFVSRMYAAAAKVKELDYYTWLNREFR